MRFVAGARRAVPLRQQGMKAMNGAGRARPESGMEVYAWLFMRVSGIVLLFLALGRLLIMHVMHTVVRIDYHFVAHRVMTLVWRTCVRGMLALVVLRGVDGAKERSDDDVGVSGRGGV